MKKFLLISIYLSLSACAGIPGNPEKMSPEQLREWAKDKNANIACGIANTPYGKGVATYVVLDKAVIPNGTISVDDQCKITITNIVPPKEIIK